MKISRRSVLLAFVVLTFTKIRYIPAEIQKTQSSCLLVSVDCHPIPPSPWRSICPSPGPDVLLSP